MEVEATTLLPTFRDPSGSVEIHASCVLRHVYPSAAPAVLEFLELPLARELKREGKLVETWVESRAESPSDPAQTLLLRHERVSFISYPWEWPSALWISAAELTLEICERSLPAGRILQDATPLNVLFRGSRPVFVDVLSFQPIDPANPVWYAYAQFVRTFLLPMLAYTQLGWPLQATLGCTDGYDPEEIAGSLPWYRKFQQPAFSLVTLPALLSRRKQGRAPRPPKFMSQEPELAMLVIRNTLKTLRCRLRQVSPSSGESMWSEYTETAAHYSAEDHAGKRTFIRQALAESAPRHVLDVGCNTGVYSMLAAEAGAEVVAIDSDMQALSRLAVAAGRSGKSILPLHVDLARPTPAAGWQNQEAASFLDRCRGHFDTVMMLAVIHHLLLSKQIPMGQIAALCDRLTSDNLIVEWVPPQDEMFQELVRGRETLYRGITEEAFRDAFAVYFRILRSETLDNGRVLFHMRKPGR